MDEICQSLRDEPNGFEGKAKFEPAIDMQRDPDNGISTEWVSAPTSLPLTNSPNILKMGQSNFCDDGGEPTIVQELKTVSDIPANREHDIMSKQMETEQSNKRNSGPNHACSVCGKYFMSMVTLQNHFKTHFKGNSKEKPHICKECSRSFKQLSNLIQHRRIHTGERPYGCKYCEKSFKQKSQVMQHERLHTGEKPYICSNCQRAFVQLSQLKYHEKTHRNKDSVLTGSEKYTKGKRSRKRKVKEKATKPSVDEVTPVYILKEEDIASGTISSQL